MPRIDEAFEPTIAPNTATRATLRAFVDRLRVEGTLHLHGIQQTLEELIEDLDAGRAASITFLTADIRDFLGRFLDVVGLGAHVLRTIATFDPAYDQALVPARRELAVQSNLRALRELDAVTLLTVADQHTAMCKDASCATHEALRRAIAPLKEGSP